MAAYLLFFTALIWATVEDVRHRIIPDSVHVMIMISGILFIFVYHQSWVARLVSFTLVSILMILAILILDFAGGDVKLIASISFALGFLPTLVSLVIGFFLAAVYILFQKKKSDGVPLAPFILVGCLSVVPIRKFIPINILTIGAEYFA